MNLIPEDLHTEYGTPSPFSTKCGQEQRRTLGNKLKKGPSGMARVEACVRQKYGQKPPFRVMVRSTQFKTQWQRNIITTLARNIVARYISVQSGAHMQQKRVDADASASPTLLHVDSRVRAQIADQSDLHHEVCYTPSQVWMFA